MSSSIRDRIKGWCTWFQTHLPFGINNWPSWLNEGAGGLVFTALLQLAMPLGPAFAIFQALSVLYESTIDPSGYSFMDILQRLVGAILWVLLYLMVR